MQDQMVCTVLLYVMQDVYVAEFDSKNVSNNWKNVLCVLYVLCALYVLYALRSVAWGRNWSESNVQCSFVIIQSCGVTIARLILFGVFSSKSCTAC